MTQMCQEAPPAVHWRYHKYFDETLLSLPRLREVWTLLLSQKTTFKLALPEISKGKSPGIVFRHAEEMVSVVPQLM